MRRDPSFLEDIIQAADEIGEICAGLDLEGLSKGRVLQAAILHHPAVIGEAANRLSREFRSRHSEIPW